MLETFFVTDTLFWTGINTTIFAGTWDYGLYSTFNNGSTWNSINNGLPTVSFSINSLFVSGSNLLAGTGLSGVYKRPLAGIVGVEAIESTNSCIIQYSVQNTLNIINLPQNSTIQVYDISGKLLITEKNNDKFSADVSSFSKGIYIVKIQNNNQTITQKFIKE